VCGQWRESWQPGTAVSRVSLTLISLGTLATAADRDRSS
jgi:hypothetical protein